MTSSYLETLFWKCYTGDYTEAERAELMVLAREPANQETLQRLFEKVWEQPAEGEVFSEESAREIFNAVILAGQAPPARSLYRRSRMRRIWYMAAACTILVLVTTALLFIRTRVASPGYRSNPPQLRDVAPGGNKAVLTLADGTRITLDSAANGQLAQQGQAKVIKLDGGQLAYDITHGTQPVETLFNTIATPRGGQYQVILPDGTKVWLNAASTLRFPTAFTGKERRVELTGEGYFDVAKDARYPFVVSFNNMQVQVLGTGFDIMAYTDEPVPRTTLVDGSIRLINGPVHTLLEPGNTAAWKDQAFSILPADVEQVTAWISGQWSFNNVEIPVIMRQLGRWYDIDISYQGKIPEGTVGGVISRNVNLSTVLMFLQSTGIHLRQDGRKVILLP